MSSIHDDRVFRVQSQDFVSMQQPFAFKTVISVDQTNLRIDFCMCFQGWKAWFDEEAPEEATIPDGYSSSLDTFPKLLLIRSWCPDRITAQVKRR